VVAFSADHLAQPASGVGIRNAVSAGYRNQESRFEGLYLRAAVCSRLQSARDHWSATRLTREWLALAYADRTHGRRSAVSREQIFRKIETNTIYKNEAFQSLIGKFLGG
jgi:hypothetical protein